MAVLIIEWITCDKCNSGQLLDAYQGLFEGPENCALDVGWILIDGKHICLECQDEEADSPPGWIKG